MGGPHDSAHAIDPLRDALSAHVSAVNVSVVVESDCGSEKFPVASVVGTEPDIDALRSSVPHDVEGLREKQRNTEKLIFELLETKASIANSLQAFEGDDSRQHGPQSEALQRVEARCAQLETELEAQQKARAALEGEAALLRADAAEAETLRPLRAELGQLRPRVEALAEEAEKLRTQAQDRDASRRRAEKAAEEAEQRARKAERALALATSRAELAEGRLQQVEGEFAELQEHVELEKKDHTARLVALANLERDNDLLKREADGARTENEELYRRAAEMRRRQTEMEELLAEWRRRRDEAEKSLWEKVGVPSSKADWNRYHHIVPSRSNPDLIPARRMFFTQNNQSLRELERQAEKETASSLQESVLTQSALGRSSGREPREERERSRSPGPPAQARGRPASARPARPSSAGPRGATQPGAGARAAGPPKRKPAARPRSASAARPEFDRGVLSSGPFGRK